MRMIFFIALLISGNAFAGCAEDFKFLQNKEKIKLVKERVIQITSKRHLKFLIGPETKAVSNYIEFRNFSFDGDNGLEVSTELYVDRKTEEGVGHRISITDGGDHSYVRFYLMPHDDDFMILYRSWFGVNRVSEYICR